MDIRKLMQILACILHRDTYTIEVAATDAVLGLKHKIELKSGICVDMQRLFHEGCQLENGRTLSEYNIQRNPSYFYSIGCGVTET